MIQLAALPATAAIALPRPAGVGAAMTSDFALALALAGFDGSAPTMPQERGTAAAGQDAAAPGKILPDGVALPGAPAALPVAWLTPPARTAPAPVDRRGGIVADPLEPADGEPALQGCSGGDDDDDAPARSELPPCDPPFAGAARAEVPIPAIMPRDPASDTSRPAAAVVVNPSVPARPALAGVAASKPGTVTPAVAAPISRQADAPTVTPAVSTARTDTPPASIDPIPGHTAAPPTTLPAHADGASGSAPEEIATIPAAATPGQDTVAPSPTLPHAAPRGDLPRVVVRDEASPSQAVAPAAGRPAHARETYRSPRVVPHVGSSAEDVASRARSGPLTGAAPAAAGVLAAPPITSAPVTVPTPAPVSAAPPATAATPTTDVERVPAATVPDASPKLTAPMAGIETTRVAPMPDRTPPDAAAPSPATAIAPAPVAAPAPLADTATTAVVADPREGAAPVARRAAVPSGRAHPTPQMQSVQGDASQPRTPAPQPAAQVFAAAMFGTGQRPGRDDERDTPAAFASAVAPAIAGAMPVPAPQPAAPAIQPPLDTLRSEWMGAMIDRIETLQGEGGARDTRIRLTPDALGAVDVQIRHDRDGTVQVSMSADTPQARALLADAAPRLAEMAEARGLKLGQGDVSPGAGQQHAQRDARWPDAPVPMRPASARSEDDTETDTRIA